jgi:beta-galactosidase
MMIPDSWTGLDGACYLNLTAVQNTPTAWADIGYEVGFHQETIPTEAQTPVPMAETMSPYAMIEHAVTPTAVTVTTATTTYKIDRTKGLVTSIVDQGMEMLTTPITPTVWRAPTDNDRNVRHQWQGKHYHDAYVKCYACDVTAADETSVTVTAKLSLGGAVERPIMKMDATYTIYAEGGIKLDIHADVRGGYPFLPRFGVQFNMPAESEYLRYFGRGPVESYQDKRHASRQGVFASTVTNHFEHYVHPQENMAHADTGWMLVSSVAGHGLLAVSTGNAFSFNCAHFTPKQLTDTAHDYELVPMKETCVNLDVMQSGIGSNSCGPGLDGRWQMNASSYDFSVRLMPVFEGGLDPFEEMNRA